jgi:hypothetical protein
LAVAEVAAWVALQGSSVGSVVAVRVASGKPGALGKPVGLDSKPAVSDSNKVDSANKADSGSRADLASRADSGSRASGKPADSAELGVVELSQADSAERGFLEELEFFPIT